MIVNRFISGDRVISKSCIEKSNQVQQMLNNKKFQNKSRLKVTLAILAKEILNDLAYLYRLGGGMSKFLN